MLCSEIMKQHVECLSAVESVQTAARRMRDNELGFMPVCDDQLNVLGTVTDRDLVIRVLAEKLPATTPVGDIMTPEVVACRPEDDVRIAERLMGENHKSRILCVDESGRLSGVISLSDLASFEDASRVARTLREITEREA